MAWEVEYTDEFAHWWNTLTSDEQADVTYYVRELEKRGPVFFPYSSGIKGSQFGSMRELRVQSGGKPIRIFYAFDSRRVAILLVGGRKGGNKQFYEQFVKAADRLFDRHLSELRAGHEEERSMAGHHPFAELRAKIPPEAMARGAERNKSLSDAMDLAELRQALELSQQKLAKKLRVNQPEIAKIEKRADMLVSTLGAVLRAMGADLKIIASFPNHDIQIRNFGKVSNGTRRHRGAAAKADARSGSGRRVTTKPYAAG